MRVKTSFFICYISLCKRQKEGCKRAKSTASGAELAFTHNWRGKIGGVIKTPLSRLLSRGGGGGGGYLTATKVSRQMYFQMLQRWDALEKSYDDKNRKDIKNATK